MDPDNPVIRLCAQGMRAETEGRPDEARELFLRAWQTAADDYQACVAAHYLARHQSDPEQTLHWNEECLRRADLVGDDRVRGFYASLHLNLARAHGDLGRADEARRHLELAAARLADVPAGPYADWLRLAIADGLRSTGAAEPRAVDQELSALVARLCDRGDLRPLALLLPAHQGDLGTGEDLARLVTALQMVQAARWLPEDDQRSVGDLLAALG